MTRHVVMNMAAQASNDAIRNDGRHRQSQDSDGPQKLRRPGRERFSIASD